LRKPSFLVEPAGITCLALACLAKKPELSAGQAGGILKYLRLVLLDSYVFWLSKARRIQSPSIFLGTKGKELYETLDSCRMASFATALSHQHGNLPE